MFEGVCGSVGAQMGLGPHLMQALRGVGGHVEFGMVQGACGHQVLQCWFRGRAEV